MPLSICYSWSQLFFLLLLLCNLLSNNECLKLDWKGLHKISLSFSLSLSLSPSLSLSLPLSLPPPSLSLSFDCIAMYYWIVGLIWAYKATTSLWITQSFVIHVHNVACFWGPILLHWASSSSSHWVESRSSLNWLLCYCYASPGIIPSGWGGSKHQITNRSH